MNVAITLRWYFKVDEGRKFPKLKLPGGAVIPLLSCGHCHKRPPERTQFIMIGSSDGYCHECLRDHMSEIEATDANAQSRSETTNG